MARIGARFAERYPAGDCTTLDDLASFLNAVWSKLDWGFVRLVERDDYLSIEHACAPLAVFGEGAAWASAFLEGAYQHWLHELGAGSLALQEFGLMARTVFHLWGIDRTDDFGEIVFNLVQAELMSKTAEDRREDFRDVFDLDEALVRDYRIQLDVN